MLIQPVILAGGGGTRLWPLSREYYPKQFLCLDSTFSLLQETLTRVLPDNKSGKEKILDPIIICNEEYRFLVAEQSRSVNVNPKSIILEPVGKNTAPALTCAAFLAAQENPDIVLLMMPADHVIKDVSGFYHTMLKANKLVDNNNILTFGIVPDRPETGYGYIRKGSAVEDEQNDIHAFVLDSFVEKPDKQHAMEYVQSGNYLWNSGLFMVRAATWLDAIAYFKPDIYAACKSACSSGSKDDIFFRLEQAAFTDCPPDSVDYAVMEKISGSDKYQAIVVSLEVNWSDIGSWESVFNHFEKNRDNNALVGDVVQMDTSDCLVKSEHRLVAAVGCRNMIIVETADAVLVADKNQSQEVKNIVEMLKEKTREESRMHRKVYRPWGSYESLETGPNYQVKRLTVNPGKKLSLQLHHKRAEHWVVVSGVATVTNGDKTFVLSVNESTYIPVNTRHRLANMGNEPLEVIEVQSGNYLGEDDIIRFDDDFGRETT